MEEKEIEKIITDLVAGQDVCFTSSLDENGYPAMRAMLAPRKREGLKEFYLTTNTSSAKVAAYRANPKAGLYFYDKKLYHGVLFRGEMEVIEDQTVKDEVWRDMDIIFYQNNIDPDYCVLKFTARTARYFSDYRTVDINL